MQVWAACEKKQTWKKLKLGFTHRRSPSSWTSSYSPLCEQREFIARCARLSFVVAEFQSAPQQPMRISKKQRNAFEPRPQSAVGDYFPRSAGLYISFQAPTPTPRPETMRAWKEKAAVGRGKVSKGCIYSWCTRAFQRAVRMLISQDASDVSRRPHGKPFRVRDRRGGQPPKQLSAPPGSYTLPKPLVLVNSRPYI